MVPLVFSKLPQSSGKNTLVYIILAKPILSPFCIASFLGWFLGDLPVVEASLGHTQDGVENAFLIDREGRYVYLTVLESTKTPIFVLSCRVNWGA
jgi:hypothetical protein